MILVDTSIWIDHLRTTSSSLVELLEADAVASHPFVLEELALGNLGRPRERERFLESMSDLWLSPQLSHDEALLLVDSQRLWGQGLDLVDAHLLGSTLVVPGSRLWTGDKALQRAAASLGVAHVA